MLRFGPYSVQAPASLYMRSYANNCAVTNTAMNHQHVRALVHDLGDDGLRARRAGLRSGRTCQGHISGLFAIHGVSKAYKLFLWHGNAALLCRWLCTVQGLC